MRILRGVGSTVLACGCFVGLYEKYSGATVAIVDVPGERCVAHRRGETIAAPEKTPGALMSGRPDNDRHSDT